jgi:hypothetical protein
LSYLIMTRKMKCVLGCLIDHWKCWLDFCCFTSLSFDILIFRYFDISIFRYFDVHVFKIHELVFFVEYLYIIGFENVLKIKDWAETHIVVTSEWFLSIYQQNSDLFTCFMWISLIFCFTCGSMMQISWR